MNKHRQSLSNKRLAFAISFVLQLFSHFPDFCYFLFELLFPTDCSRLFFCGSTSLAQFLKL